MFSSAFKSFSSNITSNYEISKQPSASSGAWTIFDAKKKSTGAAASVFTFDRKSLDVPSSGFGGRSSATSVKKAQDEVVERLKKEASSLARLRHPSILQLVEPVEDTRNGGLVFATEPIVASLSGALQQKDASTGSFRATTNARAAQDIELDELEVQKGLLQVAKGLEFLHDSAKLVHGNLTPDAIFINAKSDWKISGLSFAGPPSGGDAHQPTPQISLSEVLHLDPRLPPMVQLNLDYTSPDFVLDSNINFSADMFSLGLVLLACYRTPHVSPVEAHGSQSTYKKIFSSSSTAPSQSNNYLCSSKLPEELQRVLPRLITRRPAQRMNSSEFQQSEYFDNILVNTMRFLDGLPAKTAAEKSQFMRGLSRVMPQFPVSVLGKKVLIALLDELKDKELLSVILQNVFQILKTIPTRQEALSTKVLPKLVEIFLNKPKSDDRDTAREAGLVVFLEHIKLISENCSAKQFKDEALPIIHIAMESSTHSLVDASLSTLSVILPVLDFSTVKHDLFPVIANVFSKTSSLGIKVRGLEALGVLCGANEDTSISDDLTGMISQAKPNKNVSSLDKFTMQEKVLPLIKAIKTKEPAVMMAALRVLKQIALAADMEFLAIEVMPILWTFSLGPLLDLDQFKAFMSTIRSISEKIEREQIRKLKDLSTSGRNSDTRSRTMSPASPPYGSQVNGMAETQDDFAKLVLSGRTGEQKDLFAGVLTEGQKLTPNPPTFSWSSTSGNNVAAGRSQSSVTSMQALQPTSRSITPDVSMSSFPSLQPNATSSVSAWSPQPAVTASANHGLHSSNYVASTQPVTPATATNNIWQMNASTMSKSSNTAFAPMLAPPPQNRTLPSQPNSWQQPNYNISSVQLSQPSESMNALQPRQSGFQQMTPPQPKPPQQRQQQQQQQPKSGLDKYESLL